MGISVAHNRSWALAAQLRQLLSEVPGIRMLDRGRQPSAIVTATIGRLNAATLVQQLRARGINTAATLRWFGLLDFDRTSVETALRISPHYYNTEEELGVLVDALKEITGSQA